MKFKALDTESGEVVYFDCALCPHCEFGGGKLD